MIAAAATSFATFGAAIAPAGATATDPGVVELRELASDLSLLTSGLATVGRLAEPIPTLGRSAGSLARLDDLVQKSLVPRLSASHWSDIAGSGSIDFGSADDRTGQLTVTQSGDDDLRTLTFRLEVRRTVTGQPFSFTHASPAVSLSSPNGVTAKVEADLAFDVVVEKLPSGTYAPYVVGGAAAPRLSVDVEADIPDGTTVKAAVGILGVDLAEGGTDPEPDVSLHLTGTLRDPDGDGRLYFTKPDGTDGELAGEGALPGLLSIGYDPSGAGSVALALRLTASSDPGFALPAVNATVNVTWADIAVGGPSVVVSGLDVAADFTRLSLRDLADLLGQVATIVASGQRDNGKNSPLPFLSGSLADAVQGAETLRAFLEEFVVQAPPPDSTSTPVDPAQVGLPRFASLQDLIAKLNSSKNFAGNAPLIPGATIKATVSSYDSTSKRLPIALELSRQTTTPVPVVKETVATSGVGLSYGPSSVTAADPPGDAKAFTPDLAGQRIMAGASGGTISKVSADGTTATLTSPWTGIQPEANTPYAVAGPQVDAGTVNLADLLRKDHDADDTTPARGIGSANAIRSTATVAPSYKVTLGIALDLSEARTGTACTGGPGGAPCPYERTNGDGSTTVIEAEPLPVERLLVKVGAPLMTASFPMTAATDISARAGFLAVRIGGAVKVCHTSQHDDCTGAATGPMVAVHLNKLSSDPDHGYVDVRRFFSSIATVPPVRFSATTAVRGFAQGDVKVPGAEAFLPPNTSAGFRLTWGNVPDVTTRSLQIDDLSELTSFDIDPNNPQALLGVVLRVLQLLDDQMRSGGGSGLLSEQIPLVDKSLRDFLGSDESGGGPTVTYTAAGSTTQLKDTSRTGARAFPQDLKGRSLLVGTQAAVVQSVSSDGQTLVLSTLLSPVPANATPYFLRTELADAVTLLTAAPPDTLQELVRRLDERLGADSPVRFKAAPVDGKTALVVETDWERSYSTATPVKLDIGDHVLAGAAAEGLAHTRIGADVDVDLVVPLSGSGLPSDLKILDSSSISIDAQAEVSGSISGSLGPLSVALGDPSSTDPAKKAKARAHYSLGFAKQTPTNQPVSFGDFLSTVQPVVNGYEGGVDCGEGTTGAPLALCANLPMYIGSGSSYSAAGVDPIVVRLPKGSRDGTSPPTVDDLFGFDPNRVSNADARTRLDGPTPEQLSAAFASLLLDFGMIGDGLDAFLALVEDGLNSASLEGKLPLVGGDLQAGSTFVKDLRTNLDALFQQVEAKDGGRLPTIADVQKLLDEEFRKALVNAKANPDNFRLQLTCRLGDADVTQVTTDASGSTTQTYGVLALGKRGDETVPAMLGDTKNVQTTDTATVTISWNKVPNATGYRLVRKTASGSYERVGADQTASAATASVKADAAGTAQTIPTQAPLVNTCNGIDMTQLQGVQVRFDIGAGDPSATAGCVDRPAVPDDPATPAPIDESRPAQPCLSGTLPLDIGIPGLSIRAGRGPDANPAGLTAKVGYRIHLALELDRTRGLSLLTQDTAGPEISFGAAVDLTKAGTPEDPGLKAELAFLKIGISKTAGVTRPGFAAHFGIDLKAPGDANCLSGTCSTSDPDPKRLGFADLQSADAMSNVVATRLTLEAHIDWLLKANVNTALPGLQARFVLTWKDSFDPTGGTNAAKGEALTISFEQVSIDAGGFLDAVLGPVVKQIKSVTGPVQPVIDTLYAPIPVLSDLSKLAGGDDVTLITLAKAYSTLNDGPSLEFVDTVAALITFVNNLPDKGTGNLLIPVGRFDVVGKAAFATAVTPDTGGSLIGTRSAEADLRDDIDAKSYKKGTTTPSDALSGTTATKAGFAFPLLANPGSIFNLIMGQDVDLVTFDSGNLTLGFTWRQSFGPVYAPPPVFITLSGTASVTARIKAGFDTYGIRKAFQENPGRSGLGGIVQVLDGLFFFSTENGAPLPVITLYGEIAAGAAVSAVVITVGIEGGVSLTVAFAWNDPNGDGKFRLFEFGQAALRNPICLFQVSGRVGLFLRVYITLGVTPFSVSFAFTLADITLLDFNVKPDCDPQPPMLAGTTADGKTLVVFAGKFGQSHRGDPVWSNRLPDGTHVDDTFSVTTLHDYVADDPATTADESKVTRKGVRVQGLGISEDFLQPGIERVVVDGRGHNGAIAVTFLSDGKQTGAAAKNDKTPNQTGVFDLEVVAVGGGGADTFKAGTGNALIDGGAGDDTITTSDLAGRTVRIAGGAGGDGITTGNADAKVAGDSTLLGAGYADRSETLTTTRGTAGANGLVDWTKLTLPDDSGTGNDRIAVGLGSNDVFGGGGDDAVGVAADSPLAVTAPGDASLRSKGNTVVLGTGSDTFKGGTGPDTVWTATKTDAVRGTFDLATPDDDGVDEPGAADTGAVRNTVDTGTGNDTVFGGSADDHVTGGSTTSQVLHFRGGGGNDVLLGGLGKDQLFGGPGSDWVVAEPATVGPQTATEALGGAVRTYVKTPLEPGTVPSSKLLVGGDGADRVLGGDGASTLFGDRHESDACGAPVQTVLSDAPAEPTAGSPGRDLVLGGNGVDLVKAGGADDRVQAYLGKDLLCGQAGKDEVYAGGDDDTVWGGSGSDVLLGDAGADKLFGNTDDDRGFGGSGTDLLEGNDGADDLFGGTDEDILVGGTRATGRQDLGRDEIYGEAQNDVLVGDNATSAGTYPVDLAGSATAGAADFLSGGHHEDKGYGGLGDDAVNGDAGADDLEGNNGIDTVHGNAGDDQLIGGSSELSGAAGRPDGGDFLHGDDGHDLIAGDNAVLTRGADPGAVVLSGRFADGRGVLLHDLGTDPAPLTSGGDTIAGGDHVDAVFGQSGEDIIGGNDGDDLLEGGPDKDTVRGGRGDDDVVGGSSVLTGDTQSQPDTGDVLEGGDGGDVVLGDNGTLRRVGPFHVLVTGRSETGRGIDLLDLGDTAAPGTSGGDLVRGHGGQDVMLAQGGDDHVDAGSGDDYLEGGPGRDLLQGRSGQDDLVGGSYTPLTTADPVEPAVTTKGQPDSGDMLRGGGDDDVLAGDNAYLLRTGATSRVSERLGTIGPLLKRRLVLLDRENPDRLSEADGTRFDADVLAGGAGVDLAYGQDGGDLISGGGGDDYLQGNGGADVLRGDNAPEAEPESTGTAAPAVQLGSWPSHPEDGYDDGVDALDGQDDILGGSDVRGFRDGDDRIEGNGGDDAVLADNGTLVRTVVDGAERTYTARSRGTIERIADPGAAAAGESTRFCSADEALTCEVANAFGDDHVLGGAGDDGLWAQDGSDHVYGGDDDDDVFGELGDDRLWGDAGEDVLLGDRGGVRNELASGASSTATLSSVPQESYTAARDGSYLRRVDLQNDTNGQDWVGTGTEVTMPRGGLVAGGVDQIRGGTGDDQIHAGAGDDLANGDSGGDELFGADGSDVLWGGKGCDPLSPEEPCSGTDLSERGTDDRFVDHLMGGRGGDPTNPLYGADVLDWAPRGSSADCVDGPFPVESGTSSSKDPCAWFAMTGLDNVDLADNQHHHGTDWAYGGWDRDVMQGDVAANGPNPGDRLMDWNGTYNLWSHCNAAYGGYNDVRQHSPGMRDFIWVLTYGMGAGQSRADASTAGTSAFRELQMAYAEDTKSHASGAAYPSTPGHFDEPVACSP